MGALHLYAPATAQTPILIGWEVLAWPLVFGLLTVVAVGLVYGLLALGRTWGAWVAFGDPVGYPNYAEEIRSLAVSNGVDEELLAYCISAAMGRARDSRLPTTLAQAAKSWVGTKRPEWTQVQTTAQVATATSLAFTYTNIESRNRLVWAGRVVWSGLRSASELASGKLAWGRSLDH